MWVCKKCNRSFAGKRELMAHRANEHPVTQDMLVEMARLYHDGKSLEQVGRILGVAASTVSHYIEAMQENNEYEIDRCGICGRRVGIGLARTMHYARSHGLTPAEARRICQLAEHLSISEIARVVRRSRRTVGRVLGDKSGM